MRLVIAFAMALTACGPGVAARDTITTANPVREWCFAGEVMRKGSRQTGLGCFSTPDLCKYAHRLAAGRFGRLARIKAVTQCEERVR